MGRLLAMLTPLAPILPLAAVEVDAHVNANWSPDLVHYVLAMAVAGCISAIVGLAKMVQTVMKERDSAKDALRDSAAVYAEDRRKAEVAAAEARRVAEVELLQRFFPLTERVTHLTEALLPLLDATKEG